MKRYYIGVDGGGTKTKFLLCGEDGSVLGTHVTGTSHYLQCGYEGAAGVILDGLHEVVKKANGNAGADADCPIALTDISRVFIGCAGYGDVQADTARLDQVLKTVMPVPFDAGNDCENAHAGALAGKPGINLIAGTGSMGYGVNARGESARCGGWHHALGSDEGGGYWIGWRLIKEFMRQSDGRDAKTALYEQVKEALGIVRDDQLISLVVETWGLDRPKIASLAPVCSALLEENDPYADIIVRDAAKELSDIAAALKVRLRFEGEVTVSGTGSIFRIGEPLLGPLTERLRESGMIYAPPVYEPDYGAALLAMKKDGIRG